MRKYLIYSLFMAAVLSGCILGNSSSRVKNIHSLLQRLKSKDSSVRKQAAIQLGEIGYGEDVKKELIKAFNDTDKEVRDAALNAMRFLAQRELIEIYLKKTKDRDAEKRIKGIRSLAYINERLYWRDKRVLNTLLEGLKDEEIRVRESSIEVFAKRRDVRGIPYLAQSLLPVSKGKKRGDQLVIAAARALIEIGKPAAPILLKRLDEPEYENVSRIILDILFKIGEPVTDELLQIYKKADKGLKLDIVDFFAKLTDEPMLEFMLLNMLEKENDYEIAGRIIQVMRQDNVRIGKTALISLIDYMKSNRHIYDEVIYTLSYKGANMVSEFINEFKDTNSIIIKEGILRVLVKIHTHHVVSALFKLMEENKKDKWLILSYMTSFNDSRLAPIFIDIIKTNNLDMKEHAIRWLRRVGSRFVSQLLPLLNYPDKQVRLSTMAVLKEISHRAVVPYLLETLKKEKDESIRVNVIEILGKKGSEEVVETLIEEMGKKKEMLETDAAVSALINIGKPAVPYLLRVLKDDKTHKSAYAAYALAKIGDKRAINPIRDLIKERSDSGVVIYTKSSNPLLYSLEPVDAVKYALSLLEKRK